jgi:excisionase family DNA binding protein
MTVQLPSHAVHADGSVSVQEAAQVLGCSEKTIRRRIKAGTLTAHRLPTSQGYEWRVQLDGSTDQLPPLFAAQVDSQNGHLPSGAAQLDNQQNEPKNAASASVNDASNEALLKALAFAERLQRENMELAGRVGFLQAKLQTAEEQILALTPGSLKETSLEESSDEEPVVTSPIEELLSPWQKIIGWFRT